MKQKICIVTKDLLGPIKNGGIGTAMTACAEYLASAGHEVTILYPTVYSTTQPVSYWMEEYAKKGIRLESLFAEESGRALSYLVYQWLKTQTFDVIHYHDWEGIGYWTAVAKQQQLAFLNTVLVCQVHGQTLWHLEHSFQFIGNTEQLDTDYLERRSVELADCVYSPSRYMLDYMVSRGWSLPSQTQVMPNLLPASFMNQLQGCQPAPTPVKIEEIVLFGRLETRKGVELFCNAISRLYQTLDAMPRIAFLGKVGEIAGRSAAEYIARASKKWKVEPQLHVELDTIAANEYLRRPGRLAVIASVIENSPYTVLECLAQGAPFVSADVGGTAELVHADDRNRVLFRREASVLADLLRDISVNGLTPARPAIEIEDNRNQWRTWHEGLRAPAIPAPAILNREPRVSICMSTFNRPHFCRLALDSLRRQTYKNIEVVLVDDASPSAEAKSFLDHLHPSFEKSGWKIIRNEKEMWTSLARNAAAAAAEGDYFLFMDDDNIAKENEVETFVSVARATGASVLTAQQQAFEGNGGAPRFDAELPIGFMPVGANVSLGLYENCFGDLNMMVERDAWRALGGFTDERCGCEDYEFLARAVLEGYRLECIPELLFFYRVSENQLAKRYDDASLYRSFMRPIKPYIAGLPKELQLAVTFSATSRRHVERMAGHGYWKKDPAA